jgi:acetolactate synthase-1/2/3 large subunit
MFGGRELGTAFKDREGKKPYNPDFAAWARACGADGVTITKSEELAGALEQAIRNQRPCLLDVHVDAEVRPPSTGTWQLPPTPHKEPLFGKPWVA